jgi:simple sugar transport system ATP-binding protein
VFISHKIREVLALSDRITVLRNGRTVGTVVPGDVSRRDLAHMMVGRDVGMVQNASSAPPGEVRLVIRDLTVAGDRGIDAVRGLDLDVGSGEIVGIAGVSGNGQRELAEAIAGLRAPTTASIRLDGREVAGHRPALVRKAGLAYVPEERMRDGLIGDFTVADNLMLIDYRTPEYSRAGFLRSPAIRRRCSDLVSAFQVKTPGLDTPAHNLSGGNIQKLILARELSGQPKVLVVAQPTRGVDVGAAEYIHQRLLEQRDQGTAILIITEDLDEVLGLSDRILVMYEGQIVAEHTPDVSESVLGVEMMGGRSAAAV